jgi:hypothetical protein
MNVTVCCRIRPVVVSNSYIFNIINSCLFIKFLSIFYFNQNGSSNEEQYACKVQSETEIEVQNTIFELDKVFGPECSQKDVYSNLVLPMVLDALNGYNMTLFTYGQTGSGKTYTMQGIGQTDEKGIILRTAETIFTSASNISNDSCYKIFLSCMEIYQEKLIDLLSMETSRYVITTLTAFRFSAQNLFQERNFEIIADSTTEKW